MVIADWLQNELPGEIEKAYRSAVDPENREDVRALFAAVVERLLLTAAFYEATERAPHIQLISGPVLSWFELRAHGRTARVSLDPTAVNALQVERGGVVACSVGHDARYPDIQAMIAEVVRWLENGRYGDN